MLAFGRKQPLSALFWGKAEERGVVSAAGKVLRRHEPRGGEVVSAHRRSHQVSGAGHYSKLQDAAALDGGGGDRGFRWEGRSALDDQGSVSEKHGFPAEHNDECGKGLCT